MAEWVLAIDFGTSFTTAAMTGRDGRAEVLEVEESRYLPSLVYRDEDGQLLVGHAADSEARVFPERAERLPKRALASGRPTVRLGGTAVAVVDLVAAVLGEVTAEALRRHNQLPPDRVVLTHPARWGSDELDLLAQAAVQAGMPAPQFLPEPVAAAIYYTTPDLPVGAYVAVYDLGGGTFDTAVLRRTGTGYELVGAPGGDPHLGGEDFDEALLDMVGQHAQAIDPVPWQHLWHHDDRTTRKAQRTLRQEITRAKKLLSKHMSCTLYIEGYSESVRVTRPEFEAAIDTRLHDSVTELLHTIKTASLVPAQLSAVYLTGGSSRIPRVSELVGTAIGALPRTSDDPKSVVALGAIQTPTPAHPVPQAAPAAPAAGAAWGTAAMFRGNPARTGTYTTAPNILRSAWKPWHFTTSDPVSSSPAVADGTVYIGSNDDRIYALDATTGQERWTYETDNAVFSSPAVADGAAYVGSRDGRIYALDATTGNVRWTHQTGHSVSSSPAVADGTIYIGSHDGRIYALDATTGDVRWTHQTDNVVFSSPAVADGAVYIGSTDGRIYALDATTGNVCWTYQTAEPVGSSPAVADGVVYVGSYDGRIYALDAATGQKRWRHKTTGRVSSSPAVADGVVYVGSRDGRIYALDATTGDVRWTHQTGNVVFSSPAVADGAVYVGSRDGRIYALDAATGNVRWTRQTGGEVRSSPAVTDGVVYVGSLDGRIYALDAATGAASAALSQDAATTAMFRGNPAHTGTYTTAFIPRSPAWKPWHFTANGLVYSSPAVADGTVYIGSDDHQVYALDAATGNVRWTHETGGWVKSSPAVAEGTVYIGSNDHRIYALDAATGNVRWTHETGDPVLSSPAVAEGTVYIGSTDCVVYALDAATGNVRWTHETGGWVKSSPAVAEGTVYIGSDHHRVHALDATTGNVRWTYKSDGSSPAVAEGTVYIGSSDCVVYALDATTGDVRWTYKTGDPVSSSPAVADGIVYVGSNDHRIYALDATTGTSV
ncbi:PQQ-binding-like beta-propeller repeat protein [Streptomyces viridochromogenes]|uniref:outer membrane protein assembly factor BamB family protein n=1 Tax=Streptomyces viridochromogenes TaxID=1938 RepID=UPI00069FD208|nr:PQQ-binding-like beta-propeller repeat protein [Streptomyces viridochromogenes]